MATIYDVLGVAEDEEFTIPSISINNGTTYRIHNGIRQYKDGDSWWTCSNEHSLALILNDPSLIARKPKFTDDEFAFMRLIYSVVPDAYLARTIDNKLYWSDPYMASGDKHDLLPYELFPYIKPGFRIKISEILEKYDALH